MNELINQLAQTLAKQAYERIYPFGSETHVFDTIYLINNEDGTYSVTDNGEETDNLDYNGVVGVIVQCIMERAEKEYMP